jgi:hypothetical protein
VSDSRNTSIQVYPPLGHTISQHYISSTRTLDSPDEETTAPLSASLASRMEND